MEKVLFSGQASEKQKQKLMAHIEHCATCKQQYDELQREQAAWEEALYYDELPIDFTDNVMSQINTLEAGASSSGNALWTDIDSSKSPNVGLRKMRSSLFKMKVASAVLAVIVMLLAISIFVQPSLAEKIRSMFTKTEQDTFDVVDPALRSAFNQGLVTNTDLVVENAGYTLEVKEVYADPLRIRMSALLKDKNGKEIKNHPLRVVSVQVSDSNGHNIPSIMYDMSIEREEALPYYGATFNEPVITDGLEIYMVLDDSYTLQQIQQNQKGEKDFIPGKWELSYHANIRQTKSQTVLIPLNEKVTTPAGLHVQMEGITLSPSGAGLNFITSLTKEAQQRSPSDLGQRQSIYYHYEINGEPWDGYSKGLSNGSAGHGTWLSGYSNAAYNVWDQHMRWYSFETLLKNSNQKDDIKFVLDGYSISEKSDYKITFKPSEISETNPAIFNSLGDQFHITAMEYKDRGTSGHKEMLIDISKGTFTNLMNTNEQWEIEDEKGQTYPVHFGPNESSSDARFGYPSHFKSGYIFVDDLTEVPKQVTLKRTIVQRFYKDINWSFMIPKDGFVPQRELIDLGELYKQ